VQEETFPLRVERVIWETERVKTLRLQPNRGELPFRFLAGQHMGVRPCPVAGRPQGLAPGPWKHFSLSSSAENRRFAEITVLEQGKTSRSLHNLSPGDGVEVTRPVGGFTLEENTGFGPVFFGAGIGTSPIRSMIRTCLDRGQGDAVTGFLRFSSPAEALFLEEFETWSLQSPRFRFWVHFSRIGPAGEGPPDPDPLLDTAWFQERIQRPEERTCYLCLPAGLREAVRPVLLRTGVSAERIRAEAW